MYKRGETAMFNNIEQEYKKNSFERKLNKLYWLIAILIIVPIYLLSKWLDLPTFVQCVISFGLLLVILFFAFIKDYKKVVKKLKEKVPKELKGKLILYVNDKHQEDISNLVKVLLKYNYKTKGDLKIAIDYFNNRRPIKVESSILGWIISLTLTLSSFAELAYNDVTKTIDYDKLSAIVGSALGFVAAFLIIAAAIKFVMRALLTNKDLRSQLNDDLMTIYLNFDKYKNKFTKE